MASTLQRRPSGRWVEGPPSSRRPSPRRGRAPLALVAAVLLVLGGVIAAAIHWSGATLAADSTALARVQVQSFGGALDGVPRVTGSDGRAIPVTVRDGLITPQALLTPGERVSVQVNVRRPGWLSWLLGSERHQRLSLSAPTASVRDRWVTLAGGAPMRVSFDQPVHAVAYSSGARTQRRSFASPQSEVTLPRAAPAGSFEVAAAPRAWERPGAPQPVTWFPAGGSLPTAVASPSAGTHLNPGQPLRLTFSAPVASVLGDRLPTLSPRSPGSWQRVDSHTLLFTPTGAGAGLDTRVVAQLPRTVALASASGALHTTQAVQWMVPRGSTLRLDQLLAEQGYLPLNWTPAGLPPPRTAAAQLNAAVAPPRGSFSWRYPNTPPELRALWIPGQANAITRGALMALETSHGLTADGFAGPLVWRALLADALAARRVGGGYNYVYVHRNLPQSLNLWHNGRVILTSPGNTGVPSAPTQLGTFPVFEHIPVGTMSGSNPDGSHYNDPGIRWISYFNGGDALHAFTRASFGTPQSLGCVELPLASAAQVWPYTPIGTLVTIEN